MNENLKPQSFRLTQNQAEAFRAFCDEKGMSQSEGFGCLLQSLELNKAKQQLASRETEIANFENHINAIMDAFLHSLEICSNAENRIRDVVKSETQENLQAIENYKKLVEELERKNQSSEMVVKENQELQARVKEQDELIAVLKKQSSKMDDYENLQTQVIQLQKELAEKEKEMREICEKHTLEIFKLVQGNLESSTATPFQKV